MVTKTADKVEKLPFWTKSEAFGDLFFENLNISTA